LRDVKKRWVPQPLEGRGHNGGPPLEDPPPKDKHRPEWGSGPVGTYFEWKAAYAAVWNAVPRETMLRRQAKAESLGLTYREYMLEILERGRHLQPEDAERIAEIRGARRRRR
jgi:hypothetical protein